MKKLAITGFSRSGTTALTDLLNIDPRIKITYELGTLTGRSKNERSKWKRKNDGLECLFKSPIYTGDKVTRPYLKAWDTLANNADKIILCLRDPRDIFRSKYWKIIDEDPVKEYIELMGGLLEKDLSGVLPIYYEESVIDVDKLIKTISEYLGFINTLDITGHNYKPVRRFGWMKKSAVDLPFEVKQIMKEFGYE